MRIKAITARAVVFASALAFLGAVGYTLAPPNPQVRDLAALIDGAGIDINTHVNAEDSSAAVSLAGYIGAALIVLVDTSDNVTGVDYIVIKDSGDVASWTVRDSVGIDSVDNKYYDLHYRPRQTNVLIKWLFRGTSGAADTIQMGAAFLRVCQAAAC